MPKIEEELKKGETDLDENCGIKEDPVDYLREITSVNLQNLIAVNKDRASQIREIISKIKWRDDQPEILENVKKAISSCKDEEDDEFHDKILEILEPIIVDAARKQEAFFRINGILTYGIHEKANLIHIHIQPDMETSKMPFPEKKKMLLDGFSHLAEIIDKDDEIQKITAMAPLVARSPRFIKSLGFSEPVSVSEDEWKEHFLYEYQNKIPVSCSEIKRLDFLKKYLKK